MNNGIYKIENVATGDVYIGSCARRVGGFGSRWNAHRRSLRRNTHHSIVLQRAWNKYGESAFKFDVLEICSPNECISREQHYIDALSPKYNILKTAGSCLGRKASPETVRKLKNRSCDWMRGDNNWNRDPSRRASQQKRFAELDPSGYITEESIRKMSNSLRGRSKSEQHKKHISLALTGRVRSPEHQRSLATGSREWARLHNSGQNNYFHTHVLRGQDNARFSGVFRFKNASTGELFTGSKVELSNKFGLDHTKVCAICNGKRKSHKNWTFIKQENI